MNSNVVYKFLKSVGSYMQGKLFKKRDVMYGWRERLFVLQDAFLHYYLSPEDNIPRKSMHIRFAFILVANIYMHFK